jgi:hypothetical protein
MKYFLRVACTAVMILVGAELVAFFFSNHASWWVLAIGNALLIIGLDLRYGKINNG